MRETQSALKRYMLSKPKLQLLDLPNEVLDMVLSYIPKIPCHSPTVILTNNTMKNLLPASVLQVNHLLRQVSIRAIGQRCLWLHIKSILEDGAALVNDLKDVLGCLTANERAFVPGRVHEVTITIRMNGDDQAGPSTRHTTTDANSIFLPYSYQSFVTLCETLLYDSDWISRITFQHPWLPLNLQRIVENQMLPTAKLFNCHVDLEYVSPNIGQQIPRRAGPWKSIVRDMDSTMEVVQEMDANHQYWEASIACMYRLFHLQESPNDQALERTRHLLFTTRGLCHPAWKLHATSLERMRVVRTKHHLRHRASLAFVRAWREHGMAWVNNHHHHVIDLSEEDDDGFCSGLLTEPSYARFGLPDHELAELHHAKALIYELWDRDYVEIHRVHSTGRETRRTIKERCVREAWCAWRYDMKSVAYCAHLKHICEQRRFSAHVVHLRMANSGYPLDWYPGYHALDIDLRPFGWPDTPENREACASEPWTLPVINRAKTVAKLADVAYDTRRGDEYPVTVGSNIPFCRNIPIFNTYSDGLVDFCHNGASLEEIATYTRENEWLFGVKDRELSAQQHAANPEHIDEYTPLLSREWGFHN